MFDFTDLGSGLHVCWRLVKRFIHNFFHSPDRLHPLVKKLSREVCEPILNIWREANILQRFDFAGLASGPHVWRGVLRKKWFTTGEGQQIKWNYRCTGTKSNQQCAALGEAAIPSPTIQANVQKEKKTEKIVSFGRELFAWILFLTLAYEGIVVVEKVCTLENSVQLKLAVVCRLARHNHWKKKQH